MNQQKRTYNALLAIALFMAPFFIQLVHADIHHHAPTHETGFINHGSECLINTYEFQPHFLFDYDPVIPVNRIFLGEISSGYSSIYVSYTSQNIRLRAPPVVSLI
ncbi:hypothetical protein ACE1ET_00825 [Saccharicrinis sp. FJH62]|uniref:hypothetical protein n=1 Tax=Saccharicrinis sp. FJH62 TaxID=3344657 RepID=UPI0035D4E6DE